ncbi:hypothetical protein GCM10020295_71250 [Streptomyces cinereospinus]
MGLMTTFQPAIVGFSASLLRGLSPAPEADSAGSAEPDGDWLVLVCLPSSAWSSLSPPRTRKPVTPAVTTTAVAATIATSFVRLPPPLPPPGCGCGGPIGAGVSHCGCCA